MSIFGDLDIESAADDPFGVDPGTYNAVVSDVEVKDSKDGSKKGLWLTYSITECTENPAMEGRKVSEWKTIPQPEDPKNPSAEDSRAMSFLKLRLASLGIPPTHMNTVQFEDLIGIDVVITVEKNGEYTNVKRVEIPTSNGNGFSAENPFA